MAVDFRPLPKTNESQVDFGTELSGLNLENLSGKLISNKSSHTAIHILTPNL